MPLPFSKNQVRKLGQRLRAAEVVDGCDLIMLERLLAFYDTALTQVVGTIRDDAQLPTSGRLKNTGTIVEKLRRSPSPLANIQDLAGARVVLDGGSAAEQDRVVTLLAQKFSEHGWACTTVDRRVAPAQGYRAVHIVATVDELPVEIQVRTSWQHEWAEFFEKLADPWSQHPLFERRRRGRCAKGVVGAA